MAVGFVVVVSVAWRSQGSHDMLGVHRPTTVAALLTTERRVVPSTLLGVHRGTVTV